MAKFNPTAQQQTAAAKHGVYCFRSRVPIAMSLAMLHAGLATGEIVSGKSGGSFHAQGARPGKGDDANDYRRKSYLHNRAALRGWGMDAKQADAPAKTWNDDDDDDVIADDVIADVVLTPTAAKPASDGLVILTTTKTTPTTTTAAKPSPIVVSDGDAEQATDVVMQAIATLIDAGVISEAECTVTIDAMGHSLTVPVSFAVARTVLRINS